MAQVIDFLESKARLRGGGDDNSSLNALLKKAIVIKNEAPVIDASALVVPLTLKQLETAFSSRIADIILAREGASRENLSCIGYITKLFMQMAKEGEIQSWHAFDYVKEYERQRDSTLLKKGAEVCFLNYSFFIKKDDGQNNLYREVGSTLYLNFFKVSEEIIAYYMGKNFDFLGQVAKQSILSFHQKP